MTHELGVTGVDAAFESARAERRAALIAYIVAGDPDRETSLAVIDALTAAGVDLIELGIPYGDPLADGPTIAAAGQRALNNGAKFADSLEIAAEARARRAAPIVFFTYVNPVDRYGAERFARDAAAAGAVGAIVPDVPLEELDAFAPPLRAAGLAIPLLVAPTTPAERAARIAAASTGFVYLVSRLGVTGARREPDVGWIEEAVGRLRRSRFESLSVTREQLSVTREQLSVTREQLGVTREQLSVTREQLGLTDGGLPIAVGFGISTAAQVAAVGAVADGVIVGSALIDAYAGSRGADAALQAGEFAASLRAALPRR